MSLDNKIYISPPNVDIILRDLHDLCVYHDWSVHVSGTEFLVVTASCFHYAFSAVTSGPWDLSSAFVEIYNLASTHPAHVEGM